MRRTSRGRWRSRSRGAERRTTAPRPRFAVGQLREAITVTRQYLKHWPHDEFNRELLRDAERTLADLEQQR